MQVIFSVKYLGVNFDSNLTMKNRVNELCLKLIKNCRHIFQIKILYYNVDILIVLYCSLIYPFTYGIQFYGVTYPTYLKSVATLICKNELSE